MIKAQKFHLSLRLITNILLVIGFSLIVLLISSSEQNSKAKKQILGSHETDKEYVDTCLDNKSYQCYKESLIEYSRQNSIPKTIETLTDLSTTNPTVTTYCHSLAHDIGRTVYEKTDGDLGKIFTEGSTVCWSGFYHGALEKAFGRSKDLAKTAQNICTSENGVTGSFLTYQCLHGLGHGLSARFENEIFGALNVCQDLQTSYEQGSCYGGVFMENYVADGTNHQARYLSAEDPIAPCNKVGEVYKYSCYQLVSIQILKLNGYNFGEAFETCELSDKDYISVCYQSVGRDVSGYTSENQDQSILYCAQGNIQAETECIKAVATDSVYSKSNENNAVAFCQKVKNSLKSECYKSVGTSINVLYDDTDKKLQACKNVEKDFIKTCEDQLNL